MKTFICAISLLSLVLIGCVTPPAVDFTAFYSAEPRSILVVPTANQSLDVDAPNYLLSALPVPLAEKGYYVFPVNTVKFLLEQEGFYEGEQIHQQPAVVLAEMFHADAVLFVTINRWEAKYALLTTVVTVEFNYRMVDKKGGDIWKATKIMNYAPQNSNTGSPLANLVANLITAAVTRAAPNYLPLTRQANREVFFSGPAALPNGPYRNTELRQ